MNKMVKRIITVVLLAVFAVSCFFLIKNGIENRAAQKAQEDLMNEYVTVEPIETASPTDAPATPSPEPTATPIPDLTGFDVPNITIDFEGYKEKCPDTYAWIVIPGTDISYPIVQHAEDPDYYLKKTPEGKNSSAGSIFTQFYNSKDFTDNNTVIYGHNMKNGSMFAGLHKYEDAEFLEENPYVYIYLENGTVKAYEIFAAYRYGDMHLMLTYNFADEEEFADYLDGVMNLQGDYDNIRENVTVGGEDTVITLATCVANQANLRYIVAAKLVGEGTIE